MTNPKYANTQENKRTYSPPGFDAQEFLSVTTILGIESKPALYAWNAKLAAEAAVRQESEWHAIQQEQGDDAAIKWLKEAPKRSMNKSADLGTRVHHACENYPNESFLSDVRPFYEQYDRFLSEVNPEILHQEVTVLHPGFGYAGTVDMVVRIGDRTYIGDIKTGGVWPSAAMQMSAYSHATYMVEGNASKPVPWVIDGAFVLDLKPRSYKVRFCDIGNETWYAFRHARALYLWVHGIGKEVFDGKEG